MKIATIIEQLLCSQLMLFSLLFLNYAFRNYCKMKRKTIPACSYNTYLSLLSHSLSLTRLSPSPTLSVSFSHSSSPFLSLSRVVTRFGSLFSHRSTDNGGLAFNGVMGG